MSRASSNIMLALNFIFVLHIMRIGAISSVLINGSFPALLAFGDSILDTGNNNLLSTFSKCNFPPYGKDFPGGIPTGRFGNGKVFSDLIAEHLGIKSTLPAFLDPALKDEDLVTGACFASGGSGLDVRTAQLQVYQNILSIPKQFDLFKQYVAKLKGYVGSEKAEAIVSESLYLVSAGNNDIAITYFSVLRNDIDGYTTQLVSWASSFIQDMYGLGARKFAYLTTLPLGCLPSARIMVGGLLRSCFEAANQASSLFNSKLQAEINKLNDSLPGANIVLLDVYNPLLDLIQNPNKYGFVDSTDGCCASGTLICNYINPLTCPDTCTSVFWDAAHPSERAYRDIISDPSERAYRDIISDPSERAYRDIISDPSERAYRDIISDPSKRAYRDIISDPSERAYRDIISDPSERAYRDIISEILG